MVSAILRAYILLLLLVTGHVLSLNAQISETDTMPWQLHAGAAGNFAFGNVDRIFTGNNLDFVYSFPNRNWVVKTAHSYRYGTVASRKTEDDYVTSNYLYYRPDQKLYPFILLLYETNFRLKIRSRFQQGIGLTFRALKNNGNQLLKLSATLIYDHTNFYQDVLFERSESNKSYHIIRPTFRIYGHHQLHKTVSINYELIEQISLADEGDLRTIGNLGIHFRVSPALQLTARIIYNHEDITPINIKKDDLFVSYGLSIGLGPTPRTRK